ncbi:MAG: hypothetical protein DWQ04_31650 [Chloroflexi bacterium]|nr:MAG: hypothetical protein DWQ04_31650 [Chloroflexota bacterium]
MNNEQQILQKVLERYDLSGAKTQLLGSLWNRVYRVEAKNGHLYSLRLCPPTIQDKRSVEDELVWLELIISQQHVGVPCPVRNQQQKLITVVSTAEGARLSCLFEWVEGEPALKYLTPSVMRQIGRAVATLHEISRKFGRPFHENDFRNSYRYDSSLAISHREWIVEHHAEIGMENVTLLHTAVTWLLEELRRIGETSDNFGLIHADLHFENFLVRDGEVSVIDFDQLGRGHYLYDLAILIVELFDEPEDYAERWHNFKAGYQQVAALPFGEESEMNPFIVAVNLAFLDWVYNSPNPAVHKQIGQRIPATFASIRERIGL